MSRTQRKRPTPAAKAPKEPIRLETPEFKTEAEEAAWWDEHSDMLTDLLLKHGRRALIQTQSVTMRLPVQDIERARKLAERRGMGYQTLIKSLLHDALKQEEKKAS
jgi:predicted DNA binding CopG/RHH family protein